MLITLEGIDGSGKSTLMKYIGEHLTARGLSFVLTREPGGTKVSEAIREVLITDFVDEDINPITELLLMFASRSQHIQEVIIPELRQGKIVVSDRFIDSSYAYQAIGRGADFKLYRSLVAAIIDRSDISLRPDITILLDIPASVAVKRLKNRGLNDRIECEIIDHLESIRSAYLEVYEASTDRISLIDATCDIEHVRDTALAIIDNALEAWSWV